MGAYTQPYSLNVYRGPITILGARDTEVNKDKVPAFLRLTDKQWATDKCITFQVTVRAGQ